ncbi:hypothetical protein ABPG72_010150 [Tetrahymena utriculariae]
MKVSSYDSYTEEYNKAKKQYNYQAEGDEEDDEEDKEQQALYNMNKNNFGNHEMYESYENKKDYDSQVSNQESEGILDYIYKRQMTQGEEEDLQDENIKYIEEEEKQTIDNGQLQQKQQFKQKDQFYLNKKNQENLPHQNFGDIQHKIDQKIVQTPQNFQKQNYEESEIPQGVILKTVQNNRISNKNQFQKIEHIPKQICQFCDWNISRIKFLRENLHIRYFEAFNFYFAKPINEILANYALPHVITLKDYTYFYDENEYLKRYYRVEEVPPRLAVLTNFFTNSYKQTRPNLIVTNQYKVIQKRNVKQARLFMRQVAKNVNNGIGYNVNNNIYNKDDSSDSEGYSSEKNNDSNQAAANSKGSKKKTNLPSKVLNSHLSQSIGLSQNQSNQSEEQSNSQNYQEYDNYRNFIMQMSFETSTHDIYYPSFSNSKRNIQSVQSKNNIAQESQQKYKSIQLSQEQKLSTQQKNFNSEEGEESQVEITALNSNQHKDIKYGQNEYSNGENEQNPRLLELIVGDERNSQLEKKEIQNMQQIKEKKSNIQNINQIIEYMQMQGIQNYHNLLDIDQEALTQNINIRDQYLNKNANNNYDPSKRISTLVSQSSVTQPSQIHAFNAKNYIIGTNWQNLQTNTQFQSTSKQFDKLNLQELHLGSNVIYVNSINTEGRSSEPSIQPTFRDGFMMLSNPNYQNEGYRNSNSQFPLNIRDLQSNTFPLQQAQLLGQSIEDYNKTDPQRTKQNDSKKKQNSQQKSVQQVQQYILSQIKKQHDFLNMGRNQQATLSTQNSQHPFYTSLSPDIKDKKETSSRYYKQQKSNKLNHAYTNEFNEGKAKHQNNGKTVQNSSRKLLTERNFTEINLGSIFEKLKLSNRLASLENKQAQTNQSHNQENFIQKITNSSLSRNNSRKKKNHKQSEAQANKPSSNDISPIGYTPRSFKKKTQNSKEDPSASLKYIHSEQSPELSKKLSQISNLITKAQVGDKKNSVSQNHLNSNNNNNNNNSSVKKNNTSKVRDQASFEVLSGRVSVSPTQNSFKNQLQEKASSSQAHQLTTTLDHSQQGNNSVINQLIKDTNNTKSSNNITARISNISNLRNKIIGAGEQKSSMNSPSRICTDRDTQNPRLKQSKSPSLNNHGVISKITQKKAPYKRSSNNKLNGQNSHLYQKQNTNNAIHSNYYQRGEDQTNYTQINPNNSMNNITTNCNSISQTHIPHQTQQQENSSCNLQLQLLQQIKQNLAATSNTNNNSGTHIPSHHGSVPQVYQSHFGINGNSQLVSHTGNSPSHLNQKSSNKTLSQKILTNALTNTINKFYKNALKNGEIKQLKDNTAQINIQSNQKNSQANQQNRNQTTQSPQQNVINPQFYQNPSQIAQYSVESDQSPRQVQQSIQNYKKLNVKKQSNNGQTRIQTKIKGLQSDDISQKFIKSLCKQRVKQTDSIGSQNQISANLETLNSARNSSIIKVQDYKVNNQNGNHPIYGAIGSQQQQQQMQINAADSKKKQLQMRHKGSNGVQNNVNTASLNGMVSNQSINSSVNNINSIIGSSNQINNLTSNSTAQINGNQNQKIYSQKSQNPSNFNSKNNNNHPTNQQNQNSNFILNPSILNGQTNINGTHSNPSLNVFQQQNQPIKNSQAQQQLQALNQQYTNIDSNYNSNNQVNHQRIESIKKVNSPRQSQPLIKPPQNINQLSNNSLINNIQKQSEQRIIKTETPYQSEDCQIQIVNSFKNLLNQNSQNTNNLAQQNNKQKQFNLEMLSSPPSNNSQQVTSYQTSQNNQLKMKNQIGVTLSPDRIKEQKKKIIQNNEDNKNAFTQQINGQFQFLTQMAQAKKVQDEFQLGNGFYTQRNNGKNRKKSNEHLGSNQKFIQSSRGSYQGHYADLSDWKHNSISKQGNDNQQNPTSTIIQQESNQQSTLLNTSPNRPIQQQQLNQQHNIYNQNYQMSNNNQNSAPLMQQQTATLLNQKIKQLSQKFQIQ